MTLSRTRVSALLASAALVTTGLIIGTTPAHAANPTPLIVVGTSDVSDSNLMKAVIEPGFEAAYPQYDLQYVAKGTGAAITFAEAGTASALIVHAASLENQFVSPPSGPSYSLEKYGRAIFWGDYVLAGPASDPAGVLSGGNPSHDIVAAFKKIAQAGADGHATFVSRGGTPGTTVQEHAIWALVDGISKCDVTTGDGGGQSPSTSTGACSSPVGNLPSWYKTTGKTQGPNVATADSCPQATFPNGGCYVFTDRGTFQYLESGDSTDAPGGLSNLKIVTRDNSPDATGGGNLLVNSFHAYAINPAAVPANSNVDTVGATDLLNWITSPAGQTAISHHLASTGDPAFIPSAAPKITLDSVTTNVQAGSKLHVYGHIANVVPGTPALNGVPVTLSSFSGTVASTTTDATGHFMLTAPAPASQSYQVRTPAISKVEVPTLNPVFGDLLQPNVLNVGDINVVGGYIAITSAAKSGPKGIRLGGTIVPRVIGNNGVLRLYAAHPGHGLRLKEVVTLNAGQSTFSKRFTLGKGVWNFKLTYANPGVIKPVSTAGTRRVKLP